MESSWHDMGVQDLLNVVGMTWSTGSLESRVGMEINSIAC